jgi:ActR/RegA family two-component response regulator
MAANLILLGDDLIFASRIAETALSHGAAVRSVRSVNEAVLGARQVAASCAIVDLALRGLKIAELVRELRSAAPNIRIVAYGSHVDIVGLRAAREAGCDVVLPRSQFVESLATAMPEWLTDRP